MRGTAAVPCPVFHTGDLGAEMKVHFLAWLEFSLVYFLLFEFSRIEVRVRTSSGVMSISSVADSPTPSKDIFLQWFRWPGVGELSVLKSSQANQDDQLLQGVWRLGTSPNDLGSSSRVAALSVPDPGPSEAPPGSCLSRSIAQYPEPKECGMKAKPADPTGLGRGTGVYWTSKYLWRARTANFRNH